MKSFILALLSFYQNDAFRVYLTVFEKRKYETNTTVKLAFKKLTYNYSFGKREVLKHVYSQIQYETYIRCACIYI